MHQNTGSDIDILDFSSEIKESQVKNWRSVEPQLHCHFDEYLDGHFELLFWTVISHGDFRRSGFQQSFARSFSTIILDGHSQRSFWTVIFNDHFGRSFWTVISESFGQTFFDGHFEHSFWTVFLNGYFDGHLNGHFGRSFFWRLPWMVIWLVILDGHSNNDFARPFGQLFWTVISTVSFSDHFWTVIFNDHFGRSFWKVILTKNSRFKRSFI